MRLLRARARQSLFDVAVQYCGEITYAWDIARANNLELTYTFLSQRDIMVPEVSGYVTTVVPVSGIIDAATLWIMSGVWRDEALWCDGANWQD
jgi:hypothetical protein